MLIKDSEKGLQVIQILHWQILALLTGCVFKPCSCSVAKSCLTLCSLVNFSMSGFPVFHHLLEFAQTNFHWISDAIQPSHPLSSPSPPALNLSQHQGLFKWVSSLHQVAKVLELLFFFSSFFLFPWPWETWIFYLLKGGSACVCMWASRKTSSSAVGSRLPGQPLTAELTGSTSAF